MTGHNPTDRSKLGSKRHILTYKDGISLSTLITSSKTQNVTVPTNTIDNIVIKRTASMHPQGNQTKKRNLYLEKVYHFKELEKKLSRYYIRRKIHSSEEKSKSVNVIRQKGW